MNSRAPRSPGAARHAVDGRDGCRKSKVALVLQARLGGVPARWGLEGGLRRGRGRGRRGGRADDGHLELLPGVVLLDFGDDLYDEE